VETESGDIRRLGSTCAALTLRPRDAAKAKTDATHHDRTERAKAKAREWLASGVGLDKVRNWLSCYVRCFVQNGRIMMDERGADGWKQTTL